MQLLAGTSMGLTLIHPHVCGTANPHTYNWKRKPNKALVETYFFSHNSFHPSEPGGLQSPGSEGCPQSKMVLSKSYDALTLFSPKLVSLIPRKKMHFLGIDEQSTL